MTTPPVAPFEFDPIYRLPPNEMQPELSIRADMLAESRDWGHAPLGLEALHAGGVTGAGVVVCIADTGVDAAHPDLAARMVAGRDFTGGTAPTDRQGHGTHCAGITAASTNGDGLIGAAPDAKIMPVKVLGDDGSGASSWIAAGIRWAADNGADIISLSLGGPAPDPQTQSAVTYATGKGCWVVCAAGNDGGPATSYPGHYPASCAVAAVDKEIKRASFSTINAENDVAAPGVSILSTLPNGRYGTMSGTSMATPYVAGCLALVRGELKRQGRAVPNQTALLAAIKRTSKDILPAGVDSSTGSGLVNPAALIADLVGTAPPPADPPPSPGFSLPDAGGISFKRNVPWRKDPATGRWVTSGTYSMSVTAASAADVPPPDLEPHVSNLFVPTATVEAFGLPLSFLKVPARKVEGTDATAAAPIDWLVAVLKQVCAFGPQLPEPLNHAVAVLCWFANRPTAVQAQAMPDILRQALRILCQFAPYLPSPWNGILSMVCRFFPVQAADFQPGPGWAAQYAKGGSPCGGS